MTAERRIFPARTDVLPRVLAFVERRSRALGADRDASLRLMVMAEELFINTVVHGYGSSGRGRVALALAARGRDIELLAEDTAPPFNVFEDVPEPPAGADPRTARIGGLGRVLVARLAARHAYERKGPRNRVTVAVPRRGPVRAQPRKPPIRRKK